MAMRDKDDPIENYKVGPGRPPLEHRFAKGQSGNSKGRPKRAKKSLLDQVADLLNELVPATIKGRRMMLSKLGYALNGVVKAAGEGNASAGAVILNAVKLTDISAVKKRNSEADDHDYGADVRRKLDEMVERRREAAEFIPNLLVSKARPKS